VTSHPPAELVGEPQQRACDLLAIDDILVEGVLVADRLRLALGLDGTIVVAARELVEVARARFTERRLQMGERQARDVAYGARAQLMEPLGSLRTGAEEALDRQRRQKGDDLVRRDDDEPARLLQVGRDLRDELARRDADRGGDALLVGDLVLDLARDRLAVAERRALPVTSRNASSIESGSTWSVTRSRIAMKRRETCM